MKCSNFIALFILTASHICRDVLLVVCAVVHFYSLC